MKVAVSRDCPSSVLFVRRPEDQEWSPFIQAIRDEFQAYVVNWLVPFDVIVMVPRGMTQVDWSWTLIG